MNNIINEVTNKYTKNNTPNLRPGYVVRVSEKIIEGDRERIQVFEGLVLSVKHGTGINSTFTVRKIAQGRVGVERTFPLHMPFLEKIEVLKQERVRRSKLYFIREQINKKTKKRKTKEKNIIFEMSSLSESKEEKKELDKEDLQAQENKKVDNNEAISTEIKEEKINKEEDSK